METFQRVYQPGFEEVFRKDYFLKGKWGAEVFGNEHPIVLELGCGRGEYTIGLAECDPSRNYIGVDIKGARIWRGAKTANERDLLNVAFIRTRIEVIGSFFSPGEIQEIWLTFPDPQLKKRRNKKRLTAPGFLNSYRKFLSDGGVVHLKTDNEQMFLYTSELVHYNNLEVIAETPDLYNSQLADESLSIKTHYEKQYLAEGLPIRYIAFRLKTGMMIRDIPGNHA